MEASIELDPPRCTYLGEVGMAGAGICDEAAVSLVEANGTKHPRCLVHAGKIKPGTEGTITWLENSPHLIPTRPKG
ncbi:hypothetical protein EPO04_02765 [Patescibacteria group bacterium]|nr:MAG: hypothetical protein EPO04_02765 [Patescibacteria group bacterium]